MFSYTIENAKYIDKIYSILTIEEKYSLVIKRILEDFADRVSFLRRRNSPEKSISIYLLKPRRSYPLDWFEMYCWKTKFDLTYSPIDFQMDFSTVRVRFENAELEPNEIGIRLKLRLDKHGDRVFVKILSPQICKMLILLVMNYFEDAKFGLVSRSPPSFEMLVIHTPELNRVKKYIDRVPIQLIK